VALALSAIILVTSIVSLFTRGLDFGIDFTGGVLLEVGYSEAANLVSIRNRLSDAGFEDYRVTRFGADTDVQVRLPPQVGADSDAIRESLREILAADDPNVNLRRVEFVSAQVGDELAEQGGLAMIFVLLMIFDELAEQGGLAMIFVLLMIFAYVMFRFQWKFAAGAVAALAHDVILTIGFFSIFQISFDLSVIAAVLAVIGYSLNDTVVAFDRIRENFTKLRGTGSEEAMNISINEMLARTIITGVTTLIVLSALLVLGGESVAPFSIALIVGIVVGTYSSIYTASAVALLLDVSAQDLMPPEVDPDLIDELP
jgi:preprotein translocase subunit SecF